MASDSLMPRYTYVVTLNFSILILVRAVGGRVEDAARGRPGAAAIARAAAAQLYSQSCRNSLI
eukprot:8530022-Pyramimonas_sp.AAC.1